MSRTLTLCQYLTINHSVNTRSPNCEMAIKFEYHSMIYPSGRVKNHILQKNFETVAIATKEPPTYAIKDEQEEDIRGKF